MLRIFGVQIVFMEAVILMINNLNNLSGAEMIQLRNAIDKKMSIEPADDWEIYKRMVETGKLQTIKWFKDKTGMGLREAKDYCDAIWDKSLIPIQWTRISQ